MPFNSFISSTFLTSWLTYGFIYIYIYIYIFVLIINFYIINLLLVNRVNVVVVVEELCVILTMSYSNDIFEPIKRDRDDCDSDQPKNQTKFFFFFSFLSFQQQQHHHQPIKFTYSIN